MHTQIIYGCILYTPHSNTSTRNITLYVFMVLAKELLIQSPALLWVVDTDKAARQTKGITL